LAGWGLAPRVVGLRDAGAWPVNFLRERKQPRRLRLSLSGSLLILVFLLAGLALKAGFDRHDAYAYNLRAEAAAAKTAAADVEAKRHQADEIADRLGFIAAARRNGLAGPWLEALTRALPDGTWVVDIERHGQSVRLRGYSKDASALIGLVDASSRFANARFTAPLTPAGAPGTERFDLTLDLRPGGPT
jgi:general secretion pathway protein L